MAIAVVPGKELLTRGTCIFDGTEAVKELRPVLE
jgi:hypothetical protein